VAGLRPEYGVVVSGHTHQWYSCSLPNSTGAPTVVTSAGSAGRLVTTINMTLDKHTRRFVSASAHNTIAENSIRNPDGTFTRDPAKADPAVKAIADKYRTASPRSPTGSSVRSRPLSATCSGRTWRARSAT
jgi:5'-nucleotidase